MLGTALAVMPGPQPSAASTPTSVNVNQKAANAISAVSTSLLSVVLQAAPAKNPGGSVEVRLRWSLNDGWLPDGGFNLYRSDSAAPLNAAPLGAAATTNAPAQLSLGGTHTLALKNLLNTATQVPAGVVLPPLAAAASGHAASAAAAFDQLATQAQQLHGLRANLLKNAASNIPSATASQPPSTADVALAARRNLILGAALHPAVASALGLSFDDASVQVGKSYTYTLRPITGGVEGTAVASVTITVPNDDAALKPAAPSGLVAAQLGPDTVGLRWQRLNPAEELVLGTPHYDVSRAATNSTAAPSKLNDLPVLVMDLVAPGSSPGTTARQEPKSFFSDNSPPIGSFTYSVTVTDSFGRTSDPAQVTINIADWHTPPAVTFVAAELQQSPSLVTFLAAQKYDRTVPFHITSAIPPIQTMLIAWSPSVPGTDNALIDSQNPNTTVQYRIYRVDAEVKGATPVALTSQPIAGTLIPATQLAQGPARTSLVTEECTQFWKQLGSMGSSPDCAHLPVTAPGLSVSQNGLLSLLNVYTYTDNTAKPDHRYQYFVAAIYQGKPIESTRVASNIAAYPNLVPPAAPSAPTSTFSMPTPSTGSASGSQGSGSNSLILSSSGAAQKSGFMTTKQARTFSLKDWKGPIVKSPPRDVGGTLVLKWSPSKDAARYEIYRANALRSSGPPSRTVPIGVSCTSGGQTPVCLAGHSVATISVGWQTLSEAVLKDTDYSLLGTTTNAEFDDAITRSSAHYYVYRIVPVNRWNVPGPSIAYAVRVPATLPPLAPKLVAVVPGPDGGVQVEFQPVTDTGEEVTRYELWRGIISRTVTSAVNATGRGITINAPLKQSATIVRCMGQSAVSCPADTGQIPANGGLGLWMTDAPSAALSWRNTYAYWVKSVDSDLLESDSEALDATPLKISASAPASLTGMWNPTECAIDLSWQATDADTKSFIIERSVFPTTSSSNQNATAATVSTHGVPPKSVVTISAGTLGDYVQLSTVGSATTHFADFSAFPDVSYDYRVRTLDLAGNLSIPTELTQQVTVPDGCGSEIAARIGQTQLSPTTTDTGQSTESNVTVSPPPVAKPLDEIVIPSTRSQP